jgi:type IV pilus assembly protein PilB
VEEEALTRMLSQQYRVPAIDLAKVKVDERVLRLIPDDVAFKHLVLPLRRAGRTLTVAMANPTDIGAIDDLKFITSHEIEPVVAGEYTLREHLEMYYEAEDDRMAELLSDFISEEDMEFVEDEQEEISIAALQEQIDAAPVVKFINGLLTDAVAKGVSDIHIEPYEKEVRVRYRIDGTLREVMNPPMKMRAALTSRIKILADLNIAERRVPQDGRIKLRMKKRVVDFRVSTLPVIFGEKIVLRILDKGNLSFDLSTFGFEPKAATDFMEAIAKPYGSRYRAHRVREDDDALLRPLQGQYVRSQHHDRGGPGRVQPPRRESGSGADSDRDDLRSGASRVPSPGPEYHHGR